MRIRLTRRLANRIDGIDVTARRVGDMFDVTRHDGDLLVAEGWAVEIEVVQTLEALQQRRAEDRIRDQWHDENATVLNAQPDG